MRCCCVQHLLGIWLLLPLLQQLLPAEARRVDRCSLARTLLYYGMPYHELSDWICLVEGESSFNTRAINAANADGSVDWGLFQINDRYWYDIRYSVACAKYIRHQQGFSAWVAWNNRCQGFKPSVAHCFTSTRYFYG